MSPSGRRVSAQELVGPLEYEVLRALWGRSPASVGDVQDRLNTSRHDELAYTTVMTVLSRLHEKGLLDRTKQGRGYDYTPRFTEPGLVEHFSRQEVADVLKRYGSVAVNQFAQALRDSDPELLRELKAVADQEGQVDGG